MHPELFTLPFFDWPVKSYGAMLTLGFLSGVWLSMKRAERLKADPDVILNIGFLCLICGVVGARVFYVAHYWESAFANQPNPLGAALNCTSGGLEYYGGLVGAIVGSVVYMLLAKVSVRMYLDILAPAAAWGLAFGRMGCLLNGCCWGGMCVDAHNHAVVPWGIRFPHSSPAQMRQWENRQLALPAELITTFPGNVYAFPLPLALIDGPIEKREGPRAKLRLLDRDIRDLQALGGDAQEIEDLKRQREAAKKKWDGTVLENYALYNALRLPSRADPARSMTATELSELARKYASVPVHPAQVYGIINALLLSWVLLEILYRRRRHGMVFVALCLVYPITRIVLETIRVDNPHDSVGLTISQAFSLGIVAVGVILFFYIRKLPERSPRAVPFIPPTESKE